MATREDIVKLYVGYFNRAPDPEGLNYWLEEIADGSMTVAEIAQSFSVQPEAVNLYPFLRFPEIVSPEAFVTQVFLNLFNREPDDEGLEYWVGELEGGAPVGEAIINIISGAQNTDAGNDLDTLNNKVEAADNWTVSVASVPGFNYFTVDADGNLEPVPAAEEAAKGVIADVDDTQASVDAAAEKTDAFVEAILSGDTDLGASETMLSVGADMVTGTAGNDMFYARVAQNDNGEQANQLGTGDIIIGGGGTDTLDAVIQKASALNATPGSAIAMETSSVEIMEFTALTDRNSDENPTDGSEDNPEVGVNMKFTDSVDVISSSYSDADLIVYNVNTLTESGEYSERRNTEELTIRMDHTGGRTEFDDNGNDQSDDSDEFEEDIADFTVLFDQNYLLSGQTSIGEAFFFLLDQDAELRLQTGQPAEGRLDDIDKNGLIISIGGETVRIEFDAALLNPQNPNEVNTHEEFVAALQDPLQALIDDGVLPEGTTITLTEFDTVLFDENGLRLNQASLQNNTFSELIPGITVTSGDGTPIEPLGYTAPNEITGEFNVFGRFTDEFQETPEPISVNVELYKVGRGQDGGELVIGGMDTEGDNFLSNGGLGIAVFDVTVFGDETQASSLAELRSTNNQLEEIYIESAAGSEAGLIIGNGNAPTGIKDIRVLDASEFDNGLFVDAELSNEIVAKYMDLTDTDPDADDDDANFMYDFGGGDDGMFISMTDSNAIFSGSTNREDFDMQIDMGGGDDFLNTFVGSIDNFEGPSNLAWYINHVRDANDEVSGRTNSNEDVAQNENGVDVMLGGGADVFIDDASSAISIEGNAGADFIDVDDSTSGAQWVFNNVEALDQNILNNLISDQEDFINNIANMTLTVTYLGYTSTVDVVDTLGAVSGVSVLDLDINQTIKAAITGDFLLNQLLTVGDGVGRTLTVGTVVGAEHTAEDLTISVGNSRELSSSQLDNGAQHFVDGSGANAVGFERGDGSATVDGRYDSDLATTSGLGTEITGFDSTELNHNTVDGGEGRDVTLLSSADNSTSLPGLGSTETIDIDGVFGEDSTINFKAAGANGVTTTDEDVTEAYADGPGAVGFDIFDVSDLLRGNTESVYNNIEFGDGADDLDAAIDYSERKVIIIGRVDEDDDEPDIDEIREIANDNDTNPDNDENQIVITVNADNVGTFWYLNNGTGEMDVEVTRLGTQDLNIYQDADRGLIGSWEDMTIDNFYVRTQGELVELITG